MVVVDIGYRSVILNREDAMKFVEILEKAEAYERKWWSPEWREKKGMEAEYTYHVYPNENEYAMRIVTDSHYQMAKLAGKPQKD